jgi:hypothetical protein
MPDDDSILDNTHLRLGEIEVCICSYEWTTVSCVPDSLLEVQVPSGLIHERFKKALAHHIVYATIYQWSEWNL